MRERWTQFDLAKRILLIFLTGLVILFAVLYGTVGRKQVIVYDGAFLQFSEQKGVQKYTGNVNGKETEITVTDTLAVSMRFEDTVFGPYRIIFDDNAIPTEENLAMNVSTSEFLTGIEVWDGERRLFRGAYQRAGDMLLLMDENGELILQHFLMDFGSGGSYEGEPTAPEIDAILEIALMPEIISRGEIRFFWLGAFAVVACVLSLWFADELFRFHLQFQIRNAEKAEASEWELASRWIGWILLTVIALAAFIEGLTPG